MAKEVGTESLDIQLNGEPRSVTSGATVSVLLRDLKIRPDRVAVEINLEIVDRQEFDQRALQEGDRVEVISFIGGGGEKAFIRNRLKQVTHGM